MNGSNKEIEELQNALINIAGYFTNIDIPELTQSEEKACEILENMKVLEKIPYFGTFVYRMNHRDDMFPNL